jgi:hypothetical protein
VLAPAGETGEADRDRDCACEEERAEDTSEMMVSASASPSSSSPSTRSWGGDIGRLTFGGVWNGISVGEIYLLCTFEGPAASLGSSSIGVIGGGGDNDLGGDRDEIGAARNGEEASGAEEDDGGFGLRARCDRRDGVGEEAPGVLCGVALIGLTPPPTSSRILPRSLP